MRHLLAVRCLRPDSLPAQELWGWVAEKAGLLRESGVCAVAIGAMQPMGTGDTDEDGDVVYIELKLAAGDLPTSVTELVTDMRLLGLRPTVLTNGMTVARDSALAVELG
jgi:hypothetical protein